jgi:hypothetical protein
LGNLEIEQFLASQTLAGFQITQLQNYSIKHSILTRKGFMANTTKLSKVDRKKSKRAARKKRKAEKPLQPRDYARGSKKPKVKKLARGQAKR